MNRHRIPDHALQRLCEHEQRVEHLVQQLARTRDAIAAARQRLDGGFERDQEYSDMRASLDELVADRPLIERNLHAAQHALSACKSWLDGLPDDAALEEVRVEVNGFDLAALQQRIADAEAELKILKAVPTPSADIKERMARYVAEMARPTISGVGDGERLRVIWPGSGFDSSGPRENRADNLSMTALVHREAMVDALMREVERMANDPLPPAARQKRIAELQAEIDTLQRQALALGAGTSGLPPAVVLGVRVAETKATRAPQRRRRAPVYSNAPERPTSRQVTG
jgi:hypothetical protein